MATIPLFTSVPGEVVPGMGQPALIANEPLVTTYPYYGHLILYYLDYLDLSTGHTLIAVPGGSYLMTPVNSRRGLSVPPPDGRWDPQSVKDFAIWHPPGSAAWDRESHFRRAASGARVSLAGARAAIGPGFVPAVLIPQQQDVIPVVHPAGSAAWDRDLHRRVFTVTVAVSLAEARAAIGPGFVPPPLVPAQADVTPVSHPAGSAAWDRDLHRRRAHPVAAILSLEEARALIGPGFVPAVLIPQQADVVVVWHPAGSAAWDREAHRRRVFTVPVALAEARARIGPGEQWPVPVMRGDAPVTWHPPGAAAWDRQAHRRRTAPPPPPLAEARAAIGPGPDMPPVVLNQPDPRPVPAPPSLAEVRAAIERAKAAHGHYAPGGCQMCMSAGARKEEVGV